MEREMQIAKRLSTPVDQSVERPHAATVQRSAPARLVAFGFAIPRHLLRLAGRAQVVVKPGAVRS